VTAQQIFLKAYIASKPPAIRALWDAVDDAARQTLAGQLRSQGYILDLQIDAWGWDPWTIMIVRLADGITWVYPMGQGPFTPVAGAQSGPPPPGTIKVSTDLAEYPPFDKAPSVAVPIIFQPTNPIGRLELAYGQPQGIGDIYATVLGDATRLGGIYSDARGTFVKEALAEMIGVVVVWKKTA